MQSFPVLNASVDEKHENIAYKVSEVNCNEKFSLIFADLYLFSNVNDVVDDVKGTERITG